MGQGEGLTLTELEKSCHCSFVKFDILKVICTFVFNRLADMMLLREVKMVEYLYGES